METKISTLMLGNFLLWIQVAIMANDKTLAKFECTSADIDHIVDHILAEKLNKHIHKDHFPVVKAIVSTLIENNETVRHYPKALPQDGMQLELFPELTKSP